MKTIQLVSIGGTILLLLGFEVVDQLAIKFFDYYNLNTSWYSALPYMFCGLLYLFFLLKKKNLLNVSFFKNTFYNKKFLIYGIAPIVCMQIVNLVFVYVNSDIQVQQNEEVILNSAVNKLSYVVGLLSAMLAFVVQIKSINSKSLLPSIVIFAFSSAILAYFSGSYLYAIPTNTLTIIIVGFTISANRASFSLGYLLSYEFLNTIIICACGKYIIGAWEANTQQDLGYTPAFLYSFQIVAMGLVAAYYGRQAYLVSMNRAELVDRGYMMVRDQHGVETPMLRATYQYNVMQEIKPWIAITEAGKKRKRGMVITQKLQKGWAFHEVFNAQGEPLTHGFIDANMDLERMSESRWQDNRPKLAIAWELDTEALYYLRVEFEGETLYGALRMFFSAEERAKQPQNFAYKLSNNWIHPNEEEILSCVLYKASGEEVLVKALYGQANPARHLPTAGDVIAG